MSEAAIFKILFIKPPGGERGPQAVDVPLAFLYLSAYLKQHLQTKVVVDLLDLRLTRNPDSALAEKLSAFQPDLIGISLLAPDRWFLNQWSGGLRRIAPNARIVIGGPGPTYEYGELLVTNPAVDWAVIGEGEVVFLNLVSALVSGGTVHDLPGVAFYDGKKVVCNSSADFIEDLDTLPFPDYGMVDLPRYFDEPGSLNGVLAEKKYTPVVSSRGCPFQCRYCHKIFGRTVRKRSPENFVSEIRWLYDELGVREFHIVDDIFNFDRERMHKILRLIINSGMTIKIAFPNGLRGDLLEREDIDLLKKAGAYMLTFAVESASPRIQKMVKKNLNIRKVLDNIDYTAEVGLLSRGFFMLGFPGETVSEIEATINLAVKSKLDFASFFSVIPFQGTELAKLAEATYPGLRYNSWNEYWGKKPFYAIATGYPLKRTQIKAYFRFYLPLRIFKTLKKMPRSGNQILLLLRWAVFIIFPRDTR